MNAQQWVLMNPVADAQAGNFRMTDRASSLDGRTVGLFWNGKPNGDIFLNEVARHLEVKFARMKIVRLWEARPETATFYGNSAESLKFMAQNADLVVGSSAD